MPPVVNQRKEIIKRNIRAARLTVDLTTEELGKQVGVTKATISNYERGKSLPSAEIVVLLCDALKVTPAWLLGVEQEYGDYRDRLNYYLGFFEALITKQDNIARINDEHPVFDRYWAALFQIDETILATLNERWPETKRIVDWLVEQQNYEKEIVSLTLFLSHYLGHTLSRYQDRIYLARKARDIAYALAQRSATDPQQQEMYLAAYFIISIDTLSWVLIETERAGEAIEVLEKCLIDLYRLTFSNMLALCQMFLARAYIVVGRTQQARELFNMINVDVLTNELIIIRYWFVGGEIAQALGEYENALTSFANATRLSEHAGVKPSESGIFYRLGFAYMRVVETSKITGMPKMKDMLLLQLGKRTFEEILDGGEHKTSNILDEFHALFGMAKYFYLAGDKTEGIARAMRVRDLLTANGLMENGIMYYHVLLGEVNKFIDQGLQSKELQ